MTKLRLEIAERFREMGERVASVESDLRLLIAVVLGVFALQWQILLRLPS